MKVPEGVIVTVIETGNEVGIARYTADDKSTPNTKDDAISVLITFLQIGWDDIRMKPEFEKVNQLPPRTYKLEALGFNSERTEQTTLTLLPSPKKSEFSRSETNAQPE